MTTASAIATLSMVLSLGNMAIVLSLISIARSIREHSVRAQRGAFESSSTQS